ncbi:MAG: hypothetical protein IJ800_04930 [Clostridia bacterium]|nr:hypothetical protein [Clostridia bacterium]
MIKLVYGPKGFGKTKIIIDDVNAVAKTAKGNVVFITDKKMDTVSIDINVRIVNTEEYGINSANAFEGFVKGLIAGNSDIEYVFIDGIARITGSGLNDLEHFFADVKKLSDGHGVNYEFTISALKEDLPQYLLAYLG